MHDIDILSSVRAHKATGPDETLARPSPLFLANNKRLPNLSQIMRHLQVQYPARCTTWFQKETFMRNAVAAVSQQIPQITQTDAILLDFSTAFDKNTR